MDNLFIFSAKYLIVASGLLAIYLVWKSDARSRKSIAMFASVSLPLSYILGVLARAMYENPRPFVVEGFTPLIEHARDNGFPSDHVLLASALAALVFAFDRRLGAVAWIITIFIAIGRVGTGVHHALDVIASMLISIIAGGMIYFFMNKRKQNATNNTPVSIER